MKNIIKKQSFLVFGVHLIGNADEIVYQKTEQVVQRRLALPEVSDEQILFFTQTFVIPFVDFFCLLKLFWTSWTEWSSEDTHATTVCEEIYIYLTIVSTTLVFILPPSKSNSRRVREPRDFSNANVVVAVVVMVAAVLLTKQILKRERARIVHPKKYRSVFVRVRVGTAQEYSFSHKFVL